MSIDTINQQDTQKGIQAFLKDQRSRGNKNLKKQRPSSALQASDREKSLAQTIEKDLRLLRTLDVSGAPGELDVKWNNLIKNEPSRFVNSDQTLKLDVLRNFRQLSIFIPDLPFGDLSLWNPVNIISGGRRGTRKLLIENYEMLAERGFLPYLRKYPSSPIGNPNTFQYNDSIYTHRWTKHIYSLGLFKKFLEPVLPVDFALLDLGSSYGIFSYLLKKEYPASTHILLDFPEQLTLAHYFLGMNFADAKIATVSDIKDQKVIDKAFIDRYDFILLPWFYYSRLQGGVVDLFSNFASFGEMKRDWFDFYLKHPAFQTAPYVFTINRFISRPTYDSDLTVLDYPLSDFKPFHFGIWPYSYHTYDKDKFFFTKKVCISSQYFEIIGKRIKGK